MVIEFMVSKRDLFCDTICHRWKSVDLMYESKRFVITYEEDKKISDSSSESWSIDFRSGSSVWFELQVLPFLPWQVQFYF